MSVDSSHAQQVIDLVDSMVAGNTPQEQLCATVPLLFKGLFAAESQSLKAATPTQIHKLCKIADNYGGADTLAAMVDFQHRHVPKSVDHLAAVAGVIDMMAGLNQLDPDSAAGALQSLIVIAANYRKLTMDDIETLTSACARFPWIKVPPLAAAAPPSPSSTSEALPAPAAAPKTSAAKPPKTSATAAPPTMCRLSMAKSDDDARFSTAILCFVGELTNTPSWLETRERRDLIADAIEMLLRLNTCIDTPTLGELASVIRDLAYRFDGFQELETLMDVYSEQRFEHPVPDPSAVDAVLVKLLNNTDAIISSGGLNGLFIFCAAMKLLMASEFSDFVESTLDRIATTSETLRKIFAASNSVGILASRIAAWANQMRSKKLEQQQMTALATLLRKRKRDAEDDGTKPKRAC